MQLRVDFSLEYRVRRDKDAKAFVAYVPMLRLFTQAKTKRQLRKSVEDLVVGFVRACHERGILDETMRGCGLVKVEDKQAQELKESHHLQYISVGNEEQELYEVPLTLLAGKQAMAECCQ